MKPSLKELDKIKISLIRKQYWLDSRLCQRAVDILLGECGDKEELELMFDLLQRFNYTNESEFWGFYKNQADSIAGDSTLTIGNCIIVPTTEGSNPSSSQDICYSFRNFLRENSSGLQKRVYNQFKPIEEFISTTNSETINIIILDDFIGSGTTIIRRMENCDRLIQTNERIKNCNYHVISLTAMETGKYNIEKHGGTVTTKHLLRKGITDYYQGPRKTRAIAKMFKLESLIFENPQNHEFSFGYKKSETLYVRVLYEETDPITQEKSIHLVRTPNNVFPIFWHSKYKEGNKRTTLLFR